MRLSAISRTADKNLSERTEIAEIPVLWQPHPENIPQCLAYESNAHVLGFGGAAGGGKSATIIGKALTKYKSSLILRREYTQMQEIERQLNHFAGEYGRYNSQRKTFTVADGRIIDLGSVQHEKDRENHQGKPHSFLAIDEATHFSEQTVRYLSIWNRSTDPNEPCQMMLTFNPPDTAAGRWVIRFFAPWLDPKHPNPAKPGELRWYAMINGVETEVSGPDIIEHGGEIIKPLSRTFIPAKIDDNPYFRETSYKSVLQGLPEPLRSMMLRGDFMAGVTDADWQVLPTAWVNAAVQRWKEYVDENCDGIPTWDENGDLINRPRHFYMTGQTGMGLDPSRGGRDENVMVVRWGEWIAPPISIPGSGVPDGIASAQHAIKFNRSGCKIVVDIIGIGSSPFDALIQLNQDAVPFNGSAAAADQHDRTGKLQFYNQRALAHWKLREALDPAYEPTLMIPDDPELIQELTTPTWELRGHKILVESKDKIKERLGRSPNKLDALLMCLLSADQIEYASAFGSAERGTVYPAEYLPLHKPHEPGERMNVKPPPKQFESGSMF